MPGGPACGILATQNRQVREHNSVERELFNQSNWCDRCNQPALDVIADGCECGEWTRTLRQSALFLS